MQVGIFQDESQDELCQKIQELSYQKDFSAKRLEEYLLSAKPG
jgi:hypothetical protein